MASAVRVLWPASSDSHSLAYNRGMANLTLVYGLRLLPSDEVAEVGAATIKLKNGRDAHVAMHILEEAKTRSRNSSRPVWLPFSTSILRYDALRYDA